MKEKFSLKESTTFRIGGEAKYFTSVNSVEELKSALGFAKDNVLPILVLGGGSNILVSDRGFDGVVIKIESKGIDVIHEDFDGVLLSVNAGEWWDDVVKYAIGNNWWGIENLSHIPGKAGSFAVQNVGAYGQEASHVVEKLTVFDTKTGKVRDLLKDECGFGYRTSIFNSSEKGRYIILNTVLKLSKHPKPNIGYSDLKQRFENNPNPQPVEIREALIQIRDSKFPFPREAKNGSAGSFFKNIIVSQNDYESILEKFRINLPDFVEKLENIKNKFLVTEGIKIPTAFILDICGAKGMFVGGAKINENQPMIIVNATGEATSDDVLGLVNKIRNVVFEKTGLYLYVEPELIGFTTEELRSYGFNQAEIGRFTLY